MLAGRTPGASRRVAIRTARPAPPRGRRGSPRRRTASTRTSSVPSGWAAHLDGSGVSLDPRRGSRLAVRAAARRFARAERGHETRSVQRTALQRGIYERNAGSRGRGRRAGGAARGRGGRRGTAGGALSLAPRRRAVLYVWVHDRFPLPALPPRRHAPSTAAPTSPCTPRPPTRSRSASSTTTAPRPASSSTERTGHVFHGVVDGRRRRHPLRPAGRTAPGTRPPACATTRTSCCSTRTPPPSTGDVRLGPGRLRPRHGRPRDDATTPTPPASMPRCVVTDRDFDWGDDARPADPARRDRRLRDPRQGLHPAAPRRARGDPRHLRRPRRTPPRSSTSPTSASPPSSCCRCTSSCRTPTSSRRACATTGATTRIGFFAPHGEYSSAGDGGGQVDEFKAMVKALHAAGLEVILDVVYNHTAEGNHLGPTLSFKGIDNAAYYRLVEGDEAHYFDTTGTGNSLNVGHPAALGLIMDSLRYWVTEMHVDGFRFDLATTLTRQGGDAEHAQRVPRPDRTRTRCCAPVKMIAEPWDTAGYQVGGFPADWSEWNGKFRDDVRDFWHGEPTACSATLAAARARQPRRLRGRPPLAAVERQLRHRARRLHPRRPHRLQREAQRGQRRGQQRRRERQQVVQLRRRGPDRRRRRQRAPRPAAPQLPRARCCSRPACR